jgi:hypothetical protein
MSHSWVGQKCLDGMFSCDIFPKKMVKTNCSGVDEQSVHLEIKCHRGRSEHLDIVLGGRFEGVETLLGHSVRGRFVKAPYSTDLHKGLYTVQLHNVGLRLTPCTVQRLQFGSPAGTVLHSICSIDFHQALYTVQRLQYGSLPGTVHCTASTAWISGRHSTLHSSAILSLAGTVHGTASAS